MTLRAGRNPTRRNRNIGTAKSGRGQDNRLVIPERWSDARTFYEKVGNHQRVVRSIHGRPITFIVEATHPGWAHACTVADCERLLGALPAEDLDGIEFLVLRQPTRKESNLRPTWGRLVYGFMYGDNCAPAIVLNATEPAGTIRWSKSLDPEDKEEFDRLREDGHDIKSTGKSHVIKSTLDSNRATQLYRTLPHELGHWVDYLRSPSKRAHDSKPKRECEAFAHRYAREVTQRLREGGVIPFLDYSTRNKK